MRLFEFKNGDLPLVVSIPHGGTWIPDALTSRFTDASRAVKDTDWFLQQLCDFAVIGVVVSLLRNWIKQQ